MQKAQQFFRRHYILTAIIVCAIFEFFMQTLGKLLCGISPALAASDNYSLQFFCELIISIVGIAIVAFLGYKHIWRSRGIGFWRGLYVGFYFVIASVFTLIVGLVGILGEGGPFEFCSIGDLLFFVGAMFLVGFAEELYFRGIISNLFFDALPRNKYGVWSAVMISGVFFGLIHAGNIASSAPQSIMVQVFVSAGMGMVLAAMYFRGRNIWSVIFLHALIDFCGLLPSTLFSTATLSESLSSFSPIQFFSVVPYIIICIFMLRRSKMNVICPFESDEERKASEAASRGTFMKYLIATLVFAAAAVAAFFAFAS